MPRLRPRSTLFPYTTLFRSAAQARLLGEIVQTYNATITASLEDLSANRPGVATFTSTEERARKVLERSEEHTSELQSLRHLVCRLLLEQKNTSQRHCIHSTS